MCKDPDADRARSAASDMYALIISKWAVEPLDIDLVPETIRPQVNVLTKNIGIRLEIALAAFGVLVASITGPSRWVRASGHPRLPLSLNFSFLTDAPLPLVHAVRRWFEPLQSFIQNGLRAAALDDPHRREENLLQLRLQVLDNADKISRAVPEATAPSSEQGASVADMRAMTAAFEAKLRRDQALKVRPRLLAQLARTRFNLFPGIVAEALGADELLYPALVSFDASLTNLSPAGETLRLLLRSQSETKRQLERLFRASWFGVADVGLRAGQPGCALVSNLWINEHAEMTAAMNSKAIAPHDLLSTFVFVDVDQPQPESSHDHSVSGAGTDKKWLQVANLLLAARLDSKETEHKLACDAELLFKKFSAEINSLLATLPTVARRFAIHWTGLVLKFALAFHLAGHDPRPDEPATTPKPTDPVPEAVQPPELINGATMGFAIKLVKRLAAGHLGVLNDGYTNKNTSTAPEGDEVQKMIAKIEKWGPLTKRALYRHYSQQCAAVLDPVLAEAVKLGRVSREGNLLKAITPPRSPNVSENVSASACQPCQSA
jgi:hypothetical protein